MAEQLPLPFTEATVRRITLITVLANGIERSVVGMYPALFADWHEVIAHVLHPFNIDHVHLHVRAAPDAVGMRTDPDADAAHAPVAEG